MIRWMNPAMRGTPSHRVRRVAFSALIGMVGIAGCSGTEAVPGDPQLSSMVVSSDPELAELTAGLIPAIEELSGLELREPIRVERRSREELERYLRTTMEQEFPPEEIERITSSYEHLGLVPDGFDFEATLVTLFTSQVAGFYEPDSTALYVLDDQNDLLFEPTLAHELVHALQDQHVDLNALTALELENDRRVAAQAAIEGHATLVMQEYTMLSLAGDSIFRLPLPVMPPSLRSVMIQMVANTPEFADVPPLITAGLTGAYVDGAYYVQSLWQEDDSRPAPFGELMPRSTEQVLEMSPPAEWADDPPLVVRFSSDHEPIYADNLGALETRVLLERVDPSAAASVVQEWSGDRFALYEGENGRGLVWVTLWDSEDGREAAFGLVERAFATSSRESRVERIEVDGRPGIRVDVGPGVPELTISWAPLETDL